MQSGRSRWLSCFSPNPQARLRLFCFPHAGGGISGYRAWAAPLAPEIELWGVRPPGRETRIAEPAYDRAEALAEAAVSQLLPLTDRPFALFGHSMGALCAFEVARLLEAAGARAVRLFVSARQAPHIEIGSESSTVLLSDADFIQELRRLDGTPSAVLDQPEVMALVLPALRRDFELCAAYARTPRQPVDCPISALGGTADPDVTPDYLESWRAYTRGAFSLRLYDGGHFFHGPNQAGVLGALREDLAPALS